MALRRLPTTIDYRALRELHPPKSRERGKADAAEAAGPPTATRQPEEPAEGATPEAEPRAVRSDGPTHAPAPENALTRDDQPSAPSTTMAATRVEGRPARGEGEARPAVRVRGYIKAPAPGTFRSYDDLVAIYGAKDAPGLALSAGLDEYMETLATRRNVALPRGFPSAGKRIDTLRTMPARSFDLAVEHLDPRGILGPFQLGSRIFNTALERFLTKA